MEEKLHISKKSQEPVVCETDLASLMEEEFKLEESKPSNKHSSALKGPPDDKFEHQTDGQILNDQELQNQKHGSKAQILGKRTTRIQGSLVEQPLESVKSRVNPSNQKRSTIGDNKRSRKRSTKPDHFNHSNTAQNNQNPQQLNFQAGNDILQPYGQQLEHGADYLQIYERNIAQQETEEIKILRQERLTMLLLDQIGSEVKFGDSEQDCDLIQVFQQLAVSTRNNFPVKLSQRYFDQFRRKMKDHFPKSIQSQQTNCEDESHESLQVDPDFLGKLRSRLNEQTLSDSRKQALTRRLCIYDNTMVKKDSWNRFESSFTNLAQNFQTQIMIPDGDLLKTQQNVSRLLNECKESAHEFKNDCLKGKFFQEQNIISQLQQELIKVDQWAKIKDKTDSKNSQAWSGKEIASLVYNSLQYGGSDVKDSLVLDLDRSSVKRSAQEIQLKWKQIQQLLLTDDLKRCDEPIEKNRLLYNLLKKLLENQVQSDLQSDEQKEALQNSFSFKNALKLWKSEQIDPREKTDFDLQIFETQQRQRLNQGQSNRQRAPAGNQQNSLTKEKSNQSMANNMQLTQELDADLKKQSVEPHKQGKQPFSVQKNSKLKSQADYQGNKQIHATGFKQLSQNDSPSKMSNNQQKSPDQKNSKINQRNNQLVYDDIQDQDSRTKLADESSVQVNSKEQELIANQFDVQKQDHAKASGKGVTKKNQQNSLNSKTPKDQAAHKQNNTLKEQQVQFNPEKGSQGLQAEVDLNASQSINKNVSNAHEGSLQTNSKIQDSEDLISMSENTYFQNQQLRQTTQQGVSSAINSVQGQQSTGQQMGYFPYPRDQQATNNASQKVVDGSNLSGDMVNQLSDPYKISRHNRFKGQIDKGLIQTGGVQNPGINQPMQFHSGSQQPAPGTGISQNAMAMANMYPPATHPMQFYPSNNEMRAGFQHAQFRQQQGVIGQQQHYGANSSTSSGGFYGANMTGRGGAANFRGHYNMHGQNYRNFGGHHQMQQTNAAGLPQSRHYQPSNMPPPPSMIHGNPMMTDMQTQQMQAKNVLPHAQHSMLNSQGMVKPRFPTYHSQGPASSGQPNMQNAVNSSMRQFPASFNLGVPQQTFSSTLQQNQKNEQEQQFSVPKAPQNREQGIGNQLSSVLVDNSQIGDSGAMHSPFTPQTPTLQHSLSNTSNSAVVFTSRQRRYQRHQELLQAQKPALNQTDNTNSQQNNQTSISTKTQQHQNQH